jgi:hypothetical protein
MEQFKIICEKDNVAIALDDLKAHTVLVIGDSNIEILNNIKFGHKFALEDIPANGRVIKYCEEIGLASTNIKKGEHVHIHNLASTRARR